MYVCMCVVVFVCVNIIERHGASLSYSLLVLHINATFHKNMALQIHINNGYMIV